MVFPPANQSSSCILPSRVTEASAQAPQAPGDALGGAESGNTAPHSCKHGRSEDTPPFELHWQGMDTLELSFPGKIKPEADKELGILKELAQGQKAKDQAKAQLKVGDRLFEVADRGGGRFFSYLLRHPDMRISVSSGKATRIPLALVSFQNEYLISVGPEAARSEAQAVLSHIGDLEGSESVSRCDIAADIGTQESIGAWGEEAWVTRAENVHRHTVKGIFSGWSIGLGAVLSARLYDKLLEIQTKSGKTYFFDLWKTNGWFYGDPVVRLEHQFRRSLLAQFALQTLADVQAARPALWSYATKEWTRLTIPSLGDATKARWPLHPFWEQIQAIKWDGRIESLSRKRPDSGSPSDRTLARMFKAVATSVMARDGLPTLEAASERLEILLMGELQRIEQWEGAAAYDLLLETVNLKRRKYCLPVIES
jgi:hypothetical protein